MILEDLIPPARQEACGVRKLTSAEQLALQSEMYRLYYDAWASAAADYLEHEGWTKATVTKIVNDKVLITTDAGEDIVLEELLPILGLSEDARIWLENTFTLTEVIGPDGDKGSYSVE